LPYVNEYGKRTGGNNAIQSGNKAKYSQNQTTRRNIRKNPEAVAAVRPSLGMSALWAGMALSGFFAAYCNLILGGLP